MHCLPPFFHAAILEMALLFLKAFVWAIWEFSWFVGSRGICALFNSILLPSNRIVRWLDETFFG